MEKINWRKVYQALASAGYSDREISGLAGRSRDIINKVRLGTYSFTHSPDYEHGKQLLERVRYLRRKGYIDAEFDEFSEPA